MKLGSAYSSPATPVYHVSRTSFSESYNLISGGKNCGVMTVSLDPTAWTMTFQFATTGNCGSFNIFWLMVGAGNYCLAVPSSATTYANSTSTFTSLGNATAGYVAPTSTGTGVLTMVSYADYGVADFRCGAITIGGVTLHGSAVIFGLNVSTVDPSVQQYAFGASSCVFSSNVNQGNVEIVATGTPTSAPTATRASLAKVVEDSGSITSIYSGLITSTGSETITSNAIQIECLEVSGISATATGSTSATGGATVPAVGSFTPTTGSFVFVVTQTTQSSGTTCGTQALTGAGSGFTDFYCNDPNAHFLVREDAPSWGGGATTATFTGSAPASWGESVGYFNPPGVTEQVTITPANSYSSSDSATV